MTGLFNEMVATPFLVEQIESPIDRVISSGAERMIWTCRERVGLSLLRDLHKESLLAGYSGFPEYRRAPHQKSQKLGVELSKSRLIADLSFPVSSLI